jgi:glyoxylase-like metal-dependent hydrolase (beta-lactamase superfamily II)
MRHLAPLMATFFLAFLRSTSTPAGDSAPHDWFQVKALDRTSYAISEPKYWQANVSYLLLGSKRALLFDTGPGVYSIGPVVRSLTRLPVLVVPSHLHFDHIGRIQEFSHVELLATERLRGELHGNLLTLSADQCLLRDACSFRVAGWLTDGESIDLGGRRVSILSTPGHTPESVTLVDSQRRRMFTGDLMNRGGTLYDVPGSDLEAAAKSLSRLEVLARERYTAYEAHSDQAIAPAEFLKTSHGILDVIAGRANGKSVCLDGIAALQFDVNGYIVVLSSDDGERLKPLASNTTEIDWRDEECASK